MEHFIESVRYTSLFEGCHPSIRDAINQLLDHATLGHSVTSKRFSTISLVRDHLDRPLAQYLQQWEIDFTFSQALKKAPLETKAFLNSVVRIAAGAYLKRPLDSFTYGKSTLVRFYHLHSRGLTDSGMVRDIDEFSATIESVFSLVDFCLRNPKRVSTPNDGKRQRVSTDWNIHHEPGLDHTGFCERCWRYSEFEEFRRKFRNHIDDSTRRMNWKEYHVHGNYPVEMPRYAVLSRRFCSEHRKATLLDENAGEDAKMQFRTQEAAYRRAYNQRRAFHAELKRVRALRGVHEWPEDVRQEAFENVQERISKTTSILRLAGDGMKQSEIARHLGISRQAVSKTLKRNKKESGSSTSR